MLYAFAANVSVNKGEKDTINFRIRNNVKDPLDWEAIIFKMGLDHTIRILQDHEVQVGILQTILRVEVQEGEMVVAGKEDPEVGEAEHPKKISHLTVATLIPVATSASAPKLQV